MAEFNAEVSRVWDALRHVEEPELQKDMVALQMVRDVARGPASPEEWITIRP